MIHLILYTRTKKGYQARKFRSRAKAMQYCKAFGLELSEYLQGQTVVSVYTTSKGTQITCTSRDTGVQPILDHLLNKLHISSNITPVRAAVFRCPVENYMLYLDNSKDHLYPFTVSLC